MSIQSLVLIAVDRFGAVVFPLRSPLISSKLCPFFILATWIIAMAVFSPHLFAFKLLEYPGGYYFWLSRKDFFGDFSSYDIYLGAILIVICLIPLVLIIILYITIYIKLKSQKIPGEQSANARQQRQKKKERNVLKMAIAIVLGFAVCWLPFCISWFLSFFLSDIWFSCSFQYFLFFAYFMTRMNCAMNTCICLILSRNYRMGLKTLFR